MTCLRSRCVIVLLLLTALPFRETTAAAVSALHRKKNSVTQLQHAALSTRRQWEEVKRGGASTAATAAASPGSWLYGSGSDFVSTVGIVAVVCAARDAIRSVVHGVMDQAETAKFLLAGAVAGIVSRTAVSPLEVVATLRMVQGGESISLTKELAMLWQKEGISGFFKGNGANCLKVAPTRGIQFFCFEAIKTKLMAWKLKQKQTAAAAAAFVQGEDELVSTAAAPQVITLSPLERLIAGGAAGMVASSLVYPLEVIKTMLTMYPGKYGNIAAAFRGVVAETGMKGLYKGLTPTLIAMFPYVGVEFMIYETSKIAIETFLNNKHIQNDGTTTTTSKNKIALPVVMTLCLGAIAGAAAQTAAHPLDVVRKRLQIQGLNGNPILYKGTLSCFQRVAAKEGASALYRGLGPACVATIPGTGIAYISYEIMKKLLGLTSA